MATQSTPKKGMTPPKGRPTRGRNEVAPDRRVFGPVAQWIAFTLLAILIFVVLVILTDGGDFNPLDGGHSGTLIDLTTFGLLAT